VRVTATGDDTTLARIIHLVERAQAQRSPSQAWVDRFARRYTPIVLVLAALVAIVPPLFMSGSFMEWGYRALVLLVISCPCALVLSTPISIVSALAAAARRGVLVKGGVHLERLGAIAAVALDKTGTLTRGALTVAEVRSVDGETAGNVVQAAASVAIRSTHPVDRAIVAHAHETGVPVETAPAARALPGHGISGTWRGAPVLVGSSRLFEQQKLLTTELRSTEAQLAAAGMAVVLVAWRGRAIGAIGLSDEMRLHGAEAIAALREEGIRHVALLTGDHRRSAAAAGIAGGLDAIEAGLLPEDKVAIVARLRSQYGPVVMIGDGINDAPALAAADVGIAMGAAGTHAAIETADIALMADDLRRVPFAIALGRATVRTIRANVAIAIALKLTFVALAVGGLATLWMAVLADVGALLLVVGNAMRLLRVR
jgi:Zn2+/Cd2+-exporting ATPase